MMPSPRRATSANHMTSLATNEGCPAFKVIEDHSAPMIVWTLYGYKIDLK
jgi:hypothetical protein